VLDPHVFGPPGSRSIPQRYVWIRIHMFLGLPDPFVREVCILSSFKNSKKNLDSYYFFTLFGYLFLKNDVNVPPKGNKHI
jgi:hypothetical protein